MIEWLYVYVAMTALAGAGSVALTVLVWRRRQVPGAVFLALMMAGAAIWCGGAIGELFAGSLSGKLLFTRLGYVGVTFVPWSLAPLLPRLYGPSLATHLAVSGGTGRAARRHARARLPQPEGPPRVDLGGAGSHHPAAPADGGTRAVVLGPRHVLVCLPARRLGRPPERGVSPGQAAHRPGRHVRPRRSPALGRQPAHHHEGGEPGRPRLDAAGDRRQRCPDHPRHRPSEGAGGRSRP